MKKIRYILYSCSIAFIFFSIVKKTFFTQNTQEIATIKLSDELLLSSKEQSELYSYIQAFYEGDANKLSSLFETKGEFEDLKVRGFVRGKIINYSLVKKNNQTYFIFEALVYYKTSKNRSFFILKNNGETWKLLVMSA
jgi:hypothetical protein